MTEEQRKRAERAIDEMAKKSDPDQRSKIDRQFADKLARLEENEQASPEMLEHLKLFWRMFNAPDDQVPWKAKAQIMAALAYFVSPFDLIPDLAGKLGYLDDAMVLRIVARRIADDIARFRGDTPGEPDLQDAQGSGEQSE